MAGGHGRAGWSDCLTVGVKVRAEVLNNRVG